MANEMKKLQKEAKRSAELRGHRLGEWRQLDQHSAVAECQDCRMQVAVNTRPQPNEIGICGEAVALHCPVEDEAVEAR